MSHKKPLPRYVVCVGNRGYRASLIVRRIYQQLADAAAEEQRMVRVVDESGEDFLFPQELFAPIELPRAVERALAAAR